MKITINLDLDNENSGDKETYHRYTISESMFDALDDLDNIRRNLRKGYVYYAKDQPEGEENSPYSLIDVEKLLADIGSVIIDSNIIE